MAKTKLTKRTVDAARPRERDFVIWDSELPRFGLRVRRSGAKTYIVQYRVKGRTRHVTIGAHGVLTPHQAKCQALALLADVQKGNDPAEAREAHRTALTVADLCDQYVEWAEAEKKPSTAQNDRRYIERFILPRIGRRKVVDITRDDLQPIVEDLRATPYQGNRVRALLSHLFRKAEEWRYRPDGMSPTARIPTFKEQKRKRYLSESELARLGEALATAEKDGSEAPQVVAAIRLLIFTGCRVSEILTLQWSFVDFEAGCLRLPDSKTGPQEILLNPPARQVLAQLPREGSLWVFPGAKMGAHLSTLVKPWKRIKVQAGLDDLRLHDLRHHADSWIMPRTRRWKAVRRGLAAISLELESA